MTLKINEAFAGAIAAEHFGVVASVRVLPGEFDKNFALTTTEGQGFILKFSHPQSPDIQLDFENAMMQHLAASSVRPLIPRPVLTLTGEAVLRLEGGLRARMQTRMPGRVLVDVPARPENLVREIGMLLGRVDRSLAQFSHPGMHREWMWDLTRAPEMIRRNLDAVRAEDLPAVTVFLERFERLVQPVLPDLPAQVIHNDANTHNLLYSEEDACLTGLIDFGDSLFSPRVCEPAISAAYLVLDASDPLQIAGQLAAGYQSVNPLTTLEWRVFWDLIGTRLAVSLSIASGRARTQSLNVYHQLTFRAASDTLVRLAKLDPGEVKKARLGSIQSTIQS